MRRPFIAGNWKMNLNRASAVALGRRRGEEGRDLEGVDLAVCPPSCYLDAVGRAIAGSKVALGAQNMYHEHDGAFTGELSAAMLRDLGCKYVILGHSERRHILGETDAAINKKVHAALAAGLIPIVCVGELLARARGRADPDGHPPPVRRLAGRPLARADGQASSSPTSRSGRSAPARWPPPSRRRRSISPFARSWPNVIMSSIADVVRIQYGGSVKPDNAAELLKQPDIDGALVGGASLKVGPIPGHRRGALVNEGRIAMDVYQHLADDFAVVDGRLFLIVLVLIQRGKGAAWPGPSAAWAAKAPSAPRPATCSPRSPSAWPPSGSSSA